MFGIHCTRKEAHPLHVQNTVHASAILQQSSQQGFTTTVQQLVAKMGGGGGGHSQKHIFKGECIIGT